LNKIMAVIKRNLYFSLTVLVLAAALAFSAGTFALLGFGNINDQTSVGHLYLGEYQEDQYASILTQKISTWKLASDYRISFQGYELPIDLDLFVFDVDTTLTELKHDQANDAYFILSDADKATLILEIDTQFTMELSAHFDFDQFFIDLGLDLSKLKSKKTYDFINYLDPAIYDNELQTVDVTAIDGTDVDAIVAAVAEITIGGNERFSLLEALSDYQLSNEQKSIIASAILAVSMNTSFDGYMFQQYNTLPDWASLGMNVRILQISGVDLSFYNDMDYDFKINIEKMGPTSLRFRLLGIPYITTYTTEAVNASVVVYDTIYLNDPTLNEFTIGVETIVTATETTYHLVTQNGVNGQVITFVRTSTPLGGTASTTVIFGEQILPINEIVNENIVTEGGD